MAVKIMLRERESIQEAVRRLRKIVDRSGLKREVRRREYYEKPSDVKRMARNRAIRRAGSVSTEGGRSDLTPSTPPPPIRNGERVAWRSHKPRRRVPCPTVTRSSRADDRQDEAGEARDGAAVHAPARSPLANRTASR